MRKIILKIGKYINKQICHICGNQKPRIIHEKLFHPQVTVYWELWSRGILIFNKMDICGVTEGRYCFSYINLIISDGNKRLRMENKMVKYVI